MSWNRVVRKISHNPVTRHADRDSNGGTPNDPTDATNKIENYSENNLMQWPGNFHKPVPRIAGKFIFIGETWWFRKSECAMQLPKRVNSKPAAMREKIMTCRFSLGPVADIVYAQYSERFGHSHENTQPNHKAFQRLGTFIGFHCWPVKLH